MDVLSCYNLVNVSVSSLGKQGDTLGYCNFGISAVKYCQNKKQKYYEKRECKNVKNEIIERIIDLLCKCNDLSILDFILQLLQKLA